MRFRALGNTGFQESVIGFGTLAIGGDDWGRLEDRDSIKAVHRAADLGVNLFDTAPLSGNGHAETVLGLAMEGPRNDVFVTGGVKTDRTGGANYSSSSGRQTDRRRSTTVTSHSAGPRKT